MMFLLFKRSLMGMKRLSAHQLRCRSALLTALLSAMTVIQPITAIAESHSDTMHESTVTVMVRAVSAPSPELSLQYPQAVRLEQVLTNAAHHWRKTVTTLNQPSLAANFTEGHHFIAIQESPLITELVHQLSTKLNTIANSNDDNAILAQLLLLQMKNQQFAARKKIELDLDRVRLRSALNPLLSGEYQLLLSSRPNSVWVFGAYGEHTLPYHSDYELSDYIATITLSAQNSHSNKSTAWVIAPDGTIERVDYAYWNNAHYQPALGSTIIIGSSDQSEPWQALEREFVELISMSSPSW
ncbi:hypothetical protein HGP28_11660 [Vibrio sp. SM6]|uniref:Capsule biosynthesis GfcC-like C-terminal domain-containing protein n=1 Tax=Vibrio agarilyticus TaxID=2726741 RepID=A0A7X8TRK4_9VIBR|nr:capsule biosynthesis GfcC D2 domain-containing protein [Vibrio agarilyticus]NLS13548.1 hypothetical protein [Vibrio agarilyticus]